MLQVVIKTFRGGQSETQFRKVPKSHCKIEFSVVCSQVIEQSLQAKDYSSAVYLSKSLTKTGQELERTFPKKKRFELCESGHDKSLIKIRDLKLYLDGQEVPTNSNED